MWGVQTGGKDGSENGSVMAEERKHESRSLTRTSGLEGRVTLDE